MTDSDISRFKEKVDIGKEDECWEWQASKNRQGYGRFWLNSKKECAHRVAFYLSMGRWPKDGKVIMHKCRNESCVNPNHLKEGTQLENVKHAYEIGNHQRKISDDVAGQIKWYLKNTNLYHRQIAEKYEGISQKQVSYINNGRTYKDVKPNCP